MLLHCWSTTSFWFSRFLQCLVKDQLKKYIKQISLFGLIRISTYIYILIFSTSVYPCTILGKYTSRILLALASVHFFLSLAWSSPFIPHHFCAFRVHFSFFPSELFCAPFLKHIDYFTFLSFFSGSRIVCYFWNTVVYVAGVICCSWHTCWIK